MAKKKTEDHITEIKKLSDQKKLTIGTNTTKKQIQKQNIKKVFITSNCKKETKDDITHSCKIYKIECIDLTQTNEELGEICKKPYTISVIGEISK